jgi:type I restriction enzyme M protein
LENDWLETIVALPEQLFYNTGIATYVWVLSNRKAAERRGKVQLIDGTAAWAPMRKSLGDKRREISAEHIAAITAVAQGQDLTGFPNLSGLIPCKIFSTSDFGYRKITVERPLRLNFQASPERLERLKGEAAFAGLAVSKKKAKAKAKAEEEEAGRKLQADVLAALESMPAEVCRDRVEFEKRLERALLAARINPAPAVKKAILNALSERDETAEICRDKKGQPEADPQLRDTENVPLAEAVESYFEREVKPHVPDAWINGDVRDEKDGQVGKVGYEINFNRYFYQYQPPRPLVEIEAEIRVLESEIMAMLREVAGGN